MNFSADRELKFQMTKITELTNYKSDKITKKRLKTNHKTNHKKSKKKKNSQKKIQK